MRKLFCLLPVLVLFVIIFKGCNMENPTDTLIHEMINPNDGVLSDTAFITKDLMIAPKNNIGQFIIWTDDEYVYFKYKSTTGYTFKNLHLAVYPFENHIPVFGGCPKTGSFPYFKTNLPNGTREYTFKVSCGILPENYKIFVSAEADLELNPPPNGINCSATAWSEGIQFGGCNNFCTFFSFYRLNK